MNALVKGSIAQVALDTKRPITRVLSDAKAVLLTDMSDSMMREDAPGNDGVVSRYEAAEMALADLQARFSGKVIVFGFSSEVHLYPSGRPARLGNGTNMAKALKAAYPYDGLKQIILISDGAPNSRRATMEQARKFSSNIDTVYIGPEEGSGQRFLQELAGATGGQALVSDAPGLLEDPVARLLLQSGV